MRFTPPFSVKLYRVSKGCKPQPQRLRAWFQSIFSLKEKFVNSSQSAWFFRNVTSSRDGNAFSVCSMTPTVSLVLVTDYLLVSDKVRYLFPEKKGNVFLRNCVNHLPACPEDNSMNQLHEVYSLFSLIIYKVDALSRAHRGDTGVCRSSVTHS